jgi:hypothetical protein
VPHAWHWPGTTVVVELESPPWVTDEDPWQTVSGAVHQVSQHDWPGPPHPLAPPHWPAWQVPPSMPLQESPCAAQVGTPLCDTQHPPSSHVLRPQHASPGPPHVSQNPASPQTSDPVPPHVLDAWPDAEQQGSPASAPHATHVPFTHSSVVAHAAGQPASLTPPPSPSSVPVPSPVLVPSTGLPSPSPPPSVSPVSVGASGVVVPVPPSGRGGSPPVSQDAKTTEATARDETTARQVRRRVKKGQP